MNQIKVTKNTDQTYTVFNPNNNLQCKCYSRKEVNQTIFRWNALNYKLKKMSLDELLNIKINHNPT